MTQYVKKFPLPGLERDESKKIIGLVRNLLNQKDDRSAIEEEIDTLVWQSFGFKEASR